MIRTTTVAQLKDLLDDYDDNDLVAFSSDYGDHCHTEQIHIIEGQADYQQVARSGYSASGWAVAEDDHDDDESQELEDYQPSTKILIIN